MNEYQVPAWLVKAAQEASAYARQMAPMLQAAQEADDMVRPYLPLIRDIQKAMNQLGMATAQSLPLPPPELVQVMNAGLREMLSSSWQQNAIVYGTVGTVRVSAPAGSVGISDATAATEDQAVAVRDSGSPAVQIVAVTVFLVILWVLTIALPPLVVLTLPVTAQSIIAGYVAAVGLALIIHWRVTDSRKR